MFQSVTFVTINSDNVGQRVDNFLLSKLKGVPKTYVYRIIRKGEVRVNKKRCKVSTRLSEGDIVRIPPVRVAEPKQLSEKAMSRHSYLLDKILYQDEQLMVINKPSGLAVHSGSGLSYGIIELMRELTQLRFLELVHRLDRDTSGCLLLAKKRSALTTLSEAFRSNSGKNHQLDKRYLALAKGNWDIQQGSIKEPLSKRKMSAGEHRVIVADEGQYAHTIFSAKQQFSDATLVEAKLLTGRTHQVRVHAQSQGHSLAGDEKYGDRLFNSKMKKVGLNRLFLHASNLKFNHPVSKERVSVVAPLADELTAVVDRLS